MKNILFRSDSSSNIGTGHIKRDLVFAKKYNSNNILFATLELKGNINSEIEKEGYSVEILKGTSFKELNSLIKMKKIDVLIIDNYQIDFNFEKKLKKNNPNLKLVCFDDTYEKHYCDVLINHNIYAKKEKYKGLVPSFTKLKCGTKYTLLRDEFKIEKRKKKQEIGSITKIFLAMGGADHSNLNIKILEVLSEFKEIRVDIVTTVANNAIDELKQYCHNKKWITLYINSNKIASIMNKSTFAIVTPSVVLNEIHYIGIPFIAIKTAENQKYMYKFLKKEKFQILSKFNKSRLKKSIEIMIEKG